jgi:hypothetical protein
MDKQSQIKLYIENPEEWNISANKDYFLEEPTEVCVIENGYILPVKGELGNYRGGVCDSDKNFIAGHRQLVNPDTASGLNISRIYDFNEKKVPYIQETVVYGGFLFNHFGHFIVECLSRIWWYIENCGCGYKFVFISDDEDIGKSPFTEYFLLLGLDEKDMIFLKEPAQFFSVIIPDQTTYILDGFKEKAMLVYNAIRDSVTPSKSEYIYFTRTKLPSNSCINEEYFENYYRAIGYEIIAPEQLPVKEQVSIMAGAKKIVCVSGSLHHHILFARDEIDITMLNRADVPYHLYQVFIWINQIRAAKFTAIDVYANFLPSFYNGSCYLLMPTMYWQKYVKDTRGGV